MTTTTTTPKPASPEEHPNWCEHTLPESLIRISENPIGGVYETDGSGTDLLWVAMSCALSTPIDTLKEALAEGAKDSAAKMRLAIAQLEQIEIDASNIRSVYEDGMSDEHRLGRHRKLQKQREFAEAIRELTPEQLAVIKVAVEEKLAEQNASVSS